MSWFRRNQNSGYLENTQTVSRPVGIFLTILTILVIGAAIFSLFLGGRWLYQHLDGSNESKDVTVTIDNTAKTPGETPKPSGETSTGSGTSTANNNAAPAATPTPTPASTSSSTTSSTNGSSSNSSTTQNSSIAATGATSSAGQGGQQSTQIPATGPDNTLAMFVIAVVLGAGVHTFVLRKKL